MVINFKCTDEKYPLKVGDVVVLLQDMSYCSKDDEDLLTEELKSFLREAKFGYYLPAGTMMEFKGNTDCCWPSFDLGNCEIDLAYDVPMPLIKIVNQNAWGL